MAQRQIRTPEDPTDPFGIAPGISSAVEDDPHEVIIAESGRELVVHLVLVAGNDDEPARSRVRLPSPGRHPERENTLARNPSPLLSRAAEPDRITEQPAHIAMHGESSVSSRASPPLALKSQIRSAVCVSEKCQVT